MWRVAALLALGALVVVILQARARDRDLEQRLDRLDARLRALPAEPTAPPLRCERGGFDSSSEALARRVAELLRVTPAAAARPLEAPRKTPTAEQQQAVDSARSIVERARARGRLGRDDVVELRRQLAAAADPDEANELTRQISVALNRQELVPEDPRFVFP
jgi:hypothetical protein